VTVLVLLARPPTRILVRAGTETGMLVGEVCPFVGKLID
jgi:hypothetical protein